MPSDLELPILDLGVAATAAGLAAATADRSLPGVLVTTQQALRLITDDELTDGGDLAALGVPVATAGPTPGARYVARVRLFDGGDFAPGAHIVGVAHLGPMPSKRPAMAASYIVFTCPVGNHRVFAHRVRPPHHCPKHPSQRLKP